MELKIFKNPFSYFSSRWKNRLVNLSFILSFTNSNGIHVVYIFTFNFLMYLKHEKGNYNDDAVQCFFLCFYEDVPVSE